LEVWVRDDEKERELLVKRIRVPSVVELVEGEPSQSRKGEVEDATRRKEWTHGCVGLEEER